MFIIVQLFTAQSVTVQASIYNQNGTMHVYMQNESLGTGYRRAEVARYSAIPQAYYTVYIAMSETLRSDCSRSV